MRESRKEENGKPDRTLGFNRMEWKGIGKKEGFGNMGRKEE